jgi:hypothetical protein
MTNKKTKTAKKISKLIEGFDNILIDANTKIETPLEVYQSLQSQRDLLFATLKSLGYTLGDKSGDYTPTPIK